MFNVGNMLARFAAEGARTGQVPTDQARMCSGCAFRNGTPANGERDAAGRALDCLMSPGELVFNCHQQRDRVCGGFQLGLAADQ